jgi:DNA-binding transcriptional ArsR family regulator
VINLVVNNSPRLDRVFSALSDPTRRSIVARLARGEASVTDLADPFDMSLPAVSKHLRVLENAGLIKRRVRGRVHHLRLLGAPLEDAARWIAHYRQFWDHQLDSLSAYLEPESTKRVSRTK